MSISVGSTFGPYELQSKLGAGGMGVVYRACDTRPGRDVAIKVLPNLVAADPEHLARFEREARLLAAMNHPHIAGIHGLEEADGVRALVLELVEGPTLAERLDAGPLPMDEALTLADQIAEALEAAHERGIVHRDLKPGNIKVRPDGTVKVLDFGLAKAVAADAVGADPSDSPTVTAAATRAGVILGTAAYMSPEQTRGKPLDKRTDVWAFGCVLYEMLVGARAFGGETVSDTLAAVLMGGPRWTRLPAATPPGIRRLLQRCLERDVKRRLRDIGDARLEIADVLAGTSESGTSEEVLTRRRRREWVAWPMAASLLVTLLVSVWVVRGSRQSSPSQPVTRTVIMLSGGEELSRSSRDYPLALSPDGARLAYVAARGGREPQLYLRDLSELDGKPIPGTTGARHPFFSPDGQWIAFFAANALQKVASAGGAPLRICEVPGISMGGSWGPNDTIVFSAASTDLFRVPAAGGTPGRVPNLAPAAWPQILPDGETVLFTSGGRAIVTISLDGSSRRVLARTSVDQSEGVEDSGKGPSLLGPGGILEVRYVSTGHLVYGQSPGIVWAVPFDLESLTLKGSPVSVVDDVYQASNGGAVYFVISGTGLLAYAHESRGRQLAWVDRNGNAASIGTDREAFRLPTLSPDGRRIAVVIDSPPRRSDIWIYDADRGTRTRLTTERHNLAPVWWPDGTRVAHSSGGSIVSHLSDGTGSEEVLVPKPVHYNYPDAWSPDGRTLLLHTKWTLTLAVVAVSLLLGLGRDLGAAVQPPQKAPQKTATSAELERRDQSVTNDNLPTTRLADMKRVLQWQQTE